MTALKSCLLDPEAPAGANRIASAVAMFRKELRIRIGLGLPGPFRRLFSIYLTLPALVASGQLAAGEVATLCQLLAHVHTQLPPLSGQQPVGAAVTPSTSDVSKSKAVSREVRIPHPKPDN